MAPTPLELTMQQLAQIALGGSQLTDLNLTVLHSLIDLILKKLRCQDETVSIGGVESKCLEKMLRSTKSSPMAFNDEQMELLGEKVDQLLALEERVERLDALLEQHFAEIRECNRAGDATNFGWSEWEKYSNSCEDLCTACEPENEVACALLKNGDFLKKMLRRISRPIIDRVFEFERKIEQLHEEFTAFLARAEEQYKKIELIEHCIYEIEGLRRAVGKQHIEFIGTMEEVQDMLDAKLDKVHLPALKKYLRDRFDAIEAELKRLQQHRDCPKAAGIVMGDVRCLSCGGAKVCSEVGVFPTGVLPTMQPGRSINAPAKRPRTCGCAGLSPEPTLMERIAVLNHAVTASTIERTELDDRKSCKLGPMGKLDLLEGTDGNLYRKG